MVVNSTRWFKQRHALPRLTGWILTGGHAVRQQPKLWTPVVPSTPLYYRHPYTPTDHRKIFMSTPNRIKSGVIKILEHLVGSPSPYWVVHDVYQAWRAFEVMYNHDGAMVTGRTNWNGHRHIVDGTWRGGGHGWRKLSSKKTHGWNQGRGRRSKKGRHSPSTDIWNQIQLENNSWLTSQLLKYARRTMICSKRICRNNWLTKCVCWYNLSTKYVCRNDLHVKYTHRKCQRLLKRTR